MAPYEGRLTDKTIAQVLPHIVEIIAADGIVGARLDAMHAWHRAQGGQHDESKHHVPWRFANAGTAFINFA